MNIRQTAIVSVLLFLCCSAGPPVRAVAQEAGEKKAAPAAEINPLKLAGKWLRADGGYVLELADVGFGGTLTASYRNPNPINVSRAAWRLEEGLVIVFVELQDVNYPGSTYTLAYFPDRDALAGYYYQAAQGQSYEVVFERLKGDD
jgi:hypothetical protein